MQTLRESGFVGRSQRGVHQYVVSGRCALVRPHHYPPDQLQHGFTVTRGERGRRGLLLPVGTRQHGLRRRKQRDQLF